MEIKDTTENQWLVSFNDVTDFYIKAIKEFGALSLLVLIQKFKKSGEYEKCLDITNAISKYDELYKTNLKDFCIKESFKFIDSIDDSNILYLYAMHYSEIIEERLINEVYI